MNLSGSSVKQYIEKKELFPQEVLVITDDFSINLGIIRVRQRVSSGGHNGLKRLRLKMKSPLRL